MQITHGTWPLRASLSQWLFDGGVYYRILYTPCTDRSWSRLPLTDNWNVAWKSPFSTHLYCFGLPMSEASSPFTPTLSIPRATWFTSSGGTSPRLLVGPSPRGPTITVVSAQVRGLVGTPNKFIIDSKEERTKMILLCLKLWPGILQYSMPGIQWRIPIVSLMTCEFRKLDRRKRKEEWNF